MTSKQRKLIRKRKERNQVLWMWGQDILGAACLFGGGYALLLIGYGLGL